MRILLFVFVAVGLFMFFGYKGSSAAPEKDERSIDYLRREVELFRPIAPGLYRGAQPPREAFQKLNDFGIRTVVNFRHEEDEIEKEAAWVKEAGMNYVSIPWSIWGKNEPEKMKQFFSVLDEPDNYPIFFHCRRGAERTGVAATIYRTHYEGLSKEDAMKKEIDAYPVRMIWKPFVKRQIDEFTAAISADEKEGSEPAAS